MPWSIQVMFGKRSFKVLGSMCKSVSKVNVSGLMCASVWVNVENSSVQVGPRYHHPLAHLQKGHQLPVDQHRLTFHSNLRQFSSFFWLAIGYLPLGPDPHVSSTALNWPLRIILRTWNFEIRLSSHHICPHFCLKPDCFLGLNGHLNFEIFTGHNLGKGLDKTDLRKSI